MRQEIMDIVLKATDNASPTFEAVQDAAEDLGQSLDNVGDEATDDMRQLEDGADQAEDDVRKLGDEAKKTGEEVDDLGDKSKSSGATMQMAFQNIADGVMRAKEGIVELGRNLMDALDLAGQQQQQETFLKMSIGAEGAAKQMKIINDLVADLPGDDVAIGGLLSQATAKNATITADELERMGTNAADYFAAMSNYGKSSVEAQQDLVNYIMQGNTAELERSPVLQAHIDKLKAATTIEERNKALQEALTEEGWAGISQQDTYNNKLETFTAMLDRGKRQMGEMFLGAASGAMDFIGDLDQATGGVLAMGIAIGSVTVGPMIDMVTGVGQMATGLKALKAAYEGTAIATAIAEGGFWSMAAAELAALWPILAIIAAVVALSVAVYEVGKYFGWWTDVGSMIDSIWAGIQRLWSAFINHPDVQGFLSALTVAWNWLVPAVTGVVNAVLRFFGVTSSSNFDFVRTLINALGVAWQAMTLPIRTVINVIKLLWTTMRTVYNNIRTAVNNIKKMFSNLPGAIRGAISSIVSILTAPFSSGYNRIKGIVNNIKSAAHSITNINIGGVTNRLTAPFQKAYSNIVSWAKKTYQDAQNWYNSIKPKSSSGGAYGFDYMGMLEAQANGETHSSMDINLNVDLSNVPAHIDTNTLISVLTDPTVLSALTNNNNFQTLDARAKNRLLMKQARAGGI